MPFLDSTEGVSHLSVSCEFKFCKLFTDEEKRMFISSVTTKTGDSTWSVAGEVLERRPRIQEQHS